MTRDEQKKFMDECHDRIRGHVANWMRNPLFKGALDRPQNQIVVEPAPDKTRARSSTG